MNNSTIFSNTKIKLYDPLAEILGVSEDGIFEYSYLDVVKLSGHSCPTVAGAFLMTKFGLEALYKDNKPIRGDIKVEIKGNKQDGTMGLIGNVASFITGACDEGGFKGLGGKSARNNLLFFGNEIKGIIKLTSMSLGKSIEVDYNPNSILPNPAMTDLMQKIFQNIATPEETKKFGELWQDRVKKILANPNEVLIFY